jgi:translation initiation factor 2B subunit (eIF-2B alpha/beta/delta family)
MKMNGWGDYPEDRSRRDLEDLERYQHNSINHPDHYGGKDNTYEAIKIIEAYDLNFSLGNVIKYVLRAGKKSENAIEDLEKAARYIEFQIDYLRRNNNV